jgi:hypothetical protein
VAGCANAWKDQLQRAKTKELRNTRSNFIENRFGFEKFGSKDMERKITFTKTFGGLVNVIFIKTH